jgi:hypothetical protein
MLLLLLLMMITLSTCIRQLLGSYLGKETGFRGFPQSI